jgi:ubiquinone/menaquinone biosynthesis C-methylase UbiE
MKRLHVGPGKAYLPGWENVDIFSNIKADVYASALALPYPIETFDMAYVCHVLEHINRNMTLSALSHWRSLLKPGGILRLAVPDFDAVVKYYTKTRSLTSLIGLLYGGQKFILDQHCIVFNEETLTMALQSVGFKEIRKWDWRQTDHSMFDDYSQAYLPSMQKDTGLLMSLNLEAIK